MGSIKPLKAEVLMRAVEKLDFRRIRQKGSHVVLHHYDGRWITISLHTGRDPTKGLIHKILKDARLTWIDIEDIL